MNLDAWQFILLALAVWRLSYMLVNEDGPADFFDRLRKLANKTPLDGVFACLYCMSVWITALLFALTLILPASWLLIDVLAVSTGAILIERVHKGEV